MTARTTIAHTTTAHTTTARTAADREMTARASGLLASVVLVASLALAPCSEARAQEQPLQAANGAALYLGALEGVMLVGVPFAIALIASRGGSAIGALGCAAVLPLCMLFRPDFGSDLAVILGAGLLGTASLLAVPPTIAGVGGPSGWDADGSLVLTTGVHGLLEGGLLGAAIDVAAGGEGVLGGLLGGLTLSAATTTYAALRHRELTHDPRAGDEANALMWTPPLAMMLSSLLLAAADLPGEVIGLVSALLGITAQAISIGLAEVALSQNASTTPMTLIER